MTRLLSCALLLSTSALAQPDAGAALTPLQVLEKMDEANNGFQDQQMDIRLTVIDVDGTKKSYDMTVQQKGDTKRLVQFTSGEMKGMATLVENPSSVYVYLPGFKKVRRVAAHNMNQSLAGSDLTSEDMANTAWAKTWSVSLDKEDATSWWLKLVPKPGNEADYSKVVHRVDKQHFAQAETHYFNKAGEKVKTFMNSDLTDFHGAKRFKMLVISDPRTGHRTEMEIREFKFNQGLKDDLFTVRQLQWGK